MTYILICLRLCKSQGIQDVKHKEDHIHVVGDSGISRPPRECLLTDFSVHLKCTCHYFRLAHSVNW